VRLKESVGCAVRGSSAMWKQLFKLVKVVADVTVGGAVVVVVVVIDVQ
jgi:hypothetical protein